MVLVSFTPICGYVLPTVQYLHSLNASGGCLVLQVNAHKKYGLARASAGLDLYA